MTTTMTPIPTRNDAERTILARLSECPDAWKSYGQLLPGGSARQQKALDAWVERGWVRLKASTYVWGNMYRLADVALANPKLAATRRRARIKSLLRERDEAMEQMAGAEMHLRGAHGEFARTALPLESGHNADWRPLHDLMNTERNAVDGLARAAYRLCAAQRAISDEIDVHGPLPEEFTVHAALGSDDPLAGDA